MDTTEESLRLELSRMSENADPSAEGRILRRVHDRRRTRRSYLAVAVGAVAALGVVTTLNITGVLGPGGQPEASSRIEDANFPNLGCDKQPMTPGALAREFQTPIWLPDNAATKVTDSYSCAGNWPVVQFGEIQVFYERAWEADDLKSTSDPGDELMTIQGQPALVSEGGDPTPFGKTKGKVMVVVDGTLIRILAPSEVPIQDLVDLAESLNLNRPLATH